METILPIVVSAVALAFSFYTFLAGRKQDRRDVMLKMHELLISDDLQRGRFLLFEKVVDEASVRALTGQDYRDINRAIATYNLLGLYVEKEYVNERDVMSVWARSIYRCWIAGQPFLLQREHDQGYKPAIYLERLAEKARQELLSKGESPEVTVWRSSLEGDPA